MTQRRLVLFGAAVVASTMSACGSNRSVEPLAGVAPVESTEPSPSQPPMAMTTAAAVTASPTADLSPTTVSITAPTTDQEVQPPPTFTARCPEPPGDETADLGVRVTVGPLDLVDNTPTTYVGPDVQRLGYTIRDTTGTARTLELGIAMLYVTTVDGEIISAPMGVEAIGVAVQVPANGEVVAPFAWSPIDCRTQLAIEPGTYRAILDVGRVGLILVEELVITS